MVPLVRELKNLDDIPAAAHELVSVLEASGLKKVAFHGEMGVGKTTFIKGMLDELGVTDHTSSPTFSIINEYASAHGKIYHFDFYRLKTPAEALDIGIEDIFSEDVWCFMEWPEKIGNFLPVNTVMVNITEENGHRLIEANV
jgi:tRNA threonylcarbamoyladenosine biosynthesis protein TsaE